ncbi:pyroglutamyl-peptidase I [Halomarina halobia]|uniref:Pyroglutamyl-peptidase I n=1 Tax=Halomarina halobia TaxID=3033386 RepID=A0ABD6AFV4_9EURY|nr:pyroglutamyl-peptidase I [Halomarina sp. PSR21]
MTTLLLTGYEPFGEYETNPTSRLVEALDGTKTGEATVVGRELPVVFDDALPALRGYLEEHEPVAVLSTGLMPGRAVLTVERVGINVRDYDGVPDNTGAEPVDQPVDLEGPDAYFATLPVRELVEELQAVGVPARISNTAGTHLCNNILYATRHHIETNGLSIRSGFVHTPFSHEQVARRGTDDPSMQFETMRTGIETMLRYLATTHE